jgi:cardiolipin synthase A/B
MRRIVLPTLVLTACISNHPAVEDPALDNLDDGKADGFGPVDAGALLWGVPSIAGLADFAYVSFELTGPADVALADSSADAAVYVYAPANGRWGHHLAKTEGDALSVHLDAGAYRALLVRRGGDAGHVTLTGTCTGAGCAAPQRNCEPLAPRTAAPELYIGPTAWQSSIDAQIDSATTTLDVQMYLFTVPEIADRIIAAARDRGVAVRVLLDPDEPHDKIAAQLTAAGIANHTDPTKFAFSHAKYLVIDNTKIVIQSGNFNAGAMTEERNYAIVDRDPDDVVDVRAIFESDWAGGVADPDLACTRLIVSPVNSGPRILAHAQSAQHTLDIEVLYLTDTTLRDAVVDRAAHGVAVRVMLSDPTRNPQNTATRDYLNAHGVPTKILLANYLHAKMIQADGVALVGSENMSKNSFANNREVGALIAEPGPAGQIHDQFELDWAAAQ